MTAVHPYPSAFTIPDANVADYLLNLDSNDGPEDEVFVLGDQVVNAWRTNGRGWKCLAWKDGDDPRACPHRAGFVGTIAADKPNASRLQPLIVEIRNVLRFDMQSAVLPMPGLALLLLGAATGQTAASASIAAGAAFSVGFGATKRLWRSRLAAMALTGTGMTIAAFLGTLLGHDPHTALAATAVMGGLCGALVRRDANSWWVWLQVVIALLLALRFPGSAENGLHRALLVAGGAGLQIAAVWMMLPLVGEPEAIATQPPVRATWREMLPHALRAAVCITAATLAAREAGLSHGYWAPMSAMLILKPGLRDTSFRGIERIGGTLAGVALATALLRLLPPEPLVLALTALLASGCAFGLQQARYAVLTTAITTAVVLMIALAGGRVVGAEVDRLLATLIGGAVALAGAAITPRRRPFRRSPDDRE